MRVSASALAWAWDNCPRCFWLRCRGLSAPGGAFGGLATRHIDRGMKAAVGVRDLVALGIPAVRVEPGSPMSATVDLDSGTSVFLVGEPDVWAHLDDGSVAPVDYKSGEAGGARRRNRYQRQVSAYALMRLASDTGQRVSDRGWIVTFDTQPGEIRFKDGAGALMGRLVAEEVGWSECGVIAMLEEAAALVGGPMPQVNPQCEDCQRFMRWVDGVHAMAMAEACRY